MPRRLSTRPLALASILLPLACARPSPSGDTEAGTGTTSGSTTDATSGAGTTTGTTSGLTTEPTGGDTGTPEPEKATIVHVFDPVTLAGFEETLPCISWTLNNEKPLYVQAISLVNSGGFHHSNGFVVPEHVYDGPDGVWDCDERGFNTLIAATEGTVLFGQSTQSLVEEQRTNPGAVIKIPPHHRIVAELHLLNLGPFPFDAQLRVGLELIHPRDVDVVLTPFEFQYTDLEIPPQSEVRYAAVCEDFLREATKDRTRPFKLHWLLPHYHYLGNHFRFEVIGGPNDGEVLYQYDGFSASPSGKRFDPPIDLQQASGLKLVCGFKNWTNDTIYWGNGNGEMCIAFGFAEAAYITQAGADHGAADGLDGGVPLFSGSCLDLVIPKLPSQGPPTAEEIAAPLYVPPVDPEQQDLPPIPECEDTPADAEPLVEPTLANIRAALLVPACSFSACHGTGGAAGGLSFEGPDLHAALLGHEVTGNTDLPLVDPGNPEGSWLYQKLSRCTPTDRDGKPATHMPLNAPFLSDPRLVAMVREWIAAGASEG
ncbi:MAG TPA: hypothetical protein VIK91_23555 [Nannocystis sp.]